ncbi:MAG: hypothetical protein ACKV2Q_05750 [Planctomycetaceae bacterium]
MTQPTSPFDESVTQTETLLSDWSATTIACRDELRPWEAFRPVIAAKRSLYQEHRLQFASLLRQARRVLGRVRPSRIAARDWWAFQWWHRRMRRLRLRIAFIASLIALNRLLWVALHLAVPVGAYRVVVLLVELAGWLMQYVSRSRGG